MGLKKGILMYGTGVIVYIRVDVPPWRLYSSVLVFYLGLCVSTWLSSEAKVKWSEWMREL